MDRSVGHRSRGGSSREQAEATPSASGDRFVHCSNQTVLSGSRVGSQHSSKAQMWDFHELNASLGHCSKHSSSRQPVETTFPRIRS